MASIRRVGRAYKVEVCYKGIRKSRTFSTLAQAKSWGAMIEAAVDAQKIGQIARKKVGDLLRKYSLEVSPKKRGARWEQIRLAKLAKYPLADIWLEDLAGAHIAEWRDLRLTEVSPGSVQREWNLLSNVFNIAIREWNWLVKNPMKDVSRPPRVSARERRYLQEEIDRICTAADYRPDLPPTTKTARVCAAFLLALETGMRGGEIAALRPRDLFLNRSFLKVTGQSTGAGKTAAAKRDVALTTEAIRILQQVSEVPKEEGDLTVFGLSAMTISVLFRRIRLKAGVVDATFHDSRHEATTRLAKKLEPLALARTIGHNDLNMLLVYYNESAEDIAARLT